MAYDTPERIQYDLGAVTTTGAGATIATIKGPAGRAGHIVDIIGRVTTSHVLGHTTAPVATRLRVGHGSAGNLLAMADWAVPAAVAGITLQASNTAGALKPEFRLPAGTDILVNTIENEGDDAAGVISYTLVVDWH